MSFLIKVLELQERGINSLSGKPRYSHKNNKYYVISHSVYKKSFFHVTTLLTVKGNSRSFSYLHNVFRLIETKFTNNLIDIITVEAIVESKK